MPAPDEHDDYTCARAWVVLRAAHALVTERLGAALARQCGLSINDFDLLLHLAGLEPAWPKLGDLNQAVALSQPALSRQVTRLEQHGLVQRIAASDDQRAVLVALTEQGHAALRAAAPVHAACVREVFTGHLTDTEQAVLVEALSRVQPIAGGAPTETSAR